MHKKEPNPSISCTVRECEYHCNTVNYCGLDSIRVGTEHKNQDTQNPADCKSFEFKH